jgi:pyruvate kinase
MEGNAMRKTKIICTLGPAVQDKETLRQLCLEGMNVARMNFSHGSHDSHLAMLNLLQEVREELGLPIGAMCDTKGPEIRTGKFQGGVAELQAGDTFTLYGEDRLGDASGCSTTYPNLYSVVQPGIRICIDDGLIELVVQEIQGKDVVCTVSNGGQVKDHKGVNLPGTPVDLPFLSRQDRSDILFAAENGFDFIAASFTRSAQDILDIRQLLDQAGATSVEIIAKIENQQGIDNIDEIIAVADGVMVARGDLGIEVPSYQVPLLQKTIIKKCRQAGKNVIVATQMLDSMIRNPRPTRAEVNDVAQAVFDGASAVMLSGETASGKYPVEALKTMADIALHAEESVDYWEGFRNIEAGHSSTVGQAISRACCTTAMDLTAKIIITVTHRGITAKAVAQFHPGCPVLALTVDERTRRHLSLVWGVETLLVPVVDSTDKLLNLARSEAWDHGYVEENDLAVVTAGIPVGISGSTNLIKVLRF